MEDADLDNPFVQPLGPNGCRCGSRHRPAQGWSVTPAKLRTRFSRTNGFEPIFRSNDGSTCNGADVSTLPARRLAFSLLLDKGLIRIALDVPAGESSNRPTTRAR
jgi:cytochrome c peroxidase